MKRLCFVVAILCLMSLLSACGGGGGGGSSSIPAKPVQGAVTNPVTNAPVSGATVSAFIQLTDIVLPNKRVGLAAPVATTTTDASGKYTFTTLNADTTYYFEVNSAGFATSTYFNITPVASSNLTLQTVNIIPANIATQTATASGMVKDAGTGAGLPNMTVKIRSGVNSKAGTVVAAQTTDTGGAYSFAALTAGTYTAEVSGNVGTTAVVTSWFPLVSIPGGTQNSNQDFSVAIAPAISSASSTVFTVGTAGTFTVTGSGTFTISGTLPSGVTYANGVLSGTPAAGSTGSYPLTITATNNGVTATQSFTLTINAAAGAAPAITSASSTVFTVGTAGTFTVTGTGTLTMSGTLPAGITFANGVLSGIPATGSNGTYPLTITATSNGTTATQSFTLTVNTAVASIVGTWVLPASQDPTANSPTALGVVTFLSNGQYMLAATDTADATGHSGMERGTYTFNPATGAFAATVIVDTNGDWGMGNGTGTTGTDVFSVTSTTLSVSGGAVLNRLQPSATNPLVGAWYSPYPNAGQAKGPVIITFIDNSNYMMTHDGDVVADPNGQPGIERGTYTWNSTTGALTVNATVDTNGQWGFSPVSASPTIITISVDGNTALMDGTVSATRVP